MPAICGLAESKFREKEKNETDIHKATEKDHVSLRQNIAGYPHEEQH